MDLNILNAKLKNIPNPEDILNIFQRLTHAENDIISLQKQDSKINDDLS